MLLNFKRVDTHLEQLMEPLFINTVACFGSKNQEDIQDYSDRLVEYLHNDLIKEEDSSSSSSSMRSASSSSSSPKRSKRITFYNTEYRYKKPDRMQQLRNRWELFVWIADREVAASCLAHFDDLFGSVEIHEVCVGRSGRGYCKELLTAVRNHLTAGLSGPLREIRIFCEKKNPAACRCYSSVFPRAIQINHPAVTGFIHLI